MIENNLIKNNSYKILIVEDTKFINDVIYKNLSKFHFQCTQVLDLAGARKSLNSYLYDYILLDLNLPDGSGVKLVKEIMSLSKAKVIILTAETDVEQREALFKDGILDYIVKDKYFNDSVTAINTIIQNLSYNKNSTILVIDDSRFLQTYIGQILKLRNYNVISAIDGKDSLKKLSKIPVNMIILDMELPDMHGLEVLRKIKRDKKLKDIPVMILSGMGNSIMVRDSYKLGASDFLQKPFNIEELVLKVELSIEFDRKSREIANKQTILNEYQNTVNRSSIVLKTDINGTIVYVNDKFCAISGYLEEELIGKNQEIIRPSYVIKQILDTQSWIGILHNTTKQGVEYWTNTVINPIIDYEGDIIEYIELSSDITEVISAKKEIEFLHKHTRDSIKVASNIQQSIVPKDKQFKHYFPDFFTLFQPKDIVSGDIYLFEELRHKDECLLMVIDCTGHGVAGAFVTMLIKAIERQIVSKIIKNNDFHVSPASILNYFNRKIKHLLRQNNKHSISNVGFDGQILYYDKKKNIMSMATARNDIFYYQDDKLNIIKGDRHSVGYKDSNPDFQFTEHTINISSKTTFYISSDGFLDQNGGAKEFPFGKKRFKKLLEEIKDKDMKTQKEELLYAFDAYRDGFEINDDVTVIGLTVTP